MRFLECSKGALFRFTLGFFRMAADDCGYLKFGHIAPRTFEGCFFGGTSLQFNVISIERYNLSYTVVGALSGPHEDMQSVLFTFLEYL